MRGKCARESGDFQMGRSPSSTTEIGPIRWLRMETCENRKVGGEREGLERKRFREVMWMIERRARGVVGCYVILLFSCCRVVYLYIFVLSVIMFFARMCA